MEFLTVMPATEDGLISMGGLQFTHHSVRKDGKSLGAANRGYQYLSKVGAASLKFEPGSVILLGGKNYFVMSTAQYTQALLELKRLMGDKNWTQLYKILTKGGDQSKDLVVSLGDYLMLYNYLPSVVKPLFVDWFKMALKSSGFRKKYPNFNLFVQGITGSSLKRRGIKRHYSRYSKYVSSVSDKFDQKYSRKFKKWDRYISLLGNYSYHLIKSIVSINSTLEKSAVIQYGSKSYDKTDSDPVKLLSKLDKSFRSYFNDIEGFKNLGYPVPKSTPSEVSKVEPVPTSSSRRSIITTDLSPAVLEYLSSESKTLRERKAKMMVKDFLLTYQEILRTKGKDAAEAFKKDWMKKNLGLSGNTYVDDSVKSRVAIMQVFLNIQLLSSGNKKVELLAVDGVLGSKTKRAIRAVQRSLGVSVDGKFGAKTLGALLNSLATYKSISNKVGSKLRKSIPKKSTPKSQPSVEELEEDDDIPII